jgi:hypothetical protein
MHVSALEITSAEAGKLKNMAKGLCEGPTVVESVTSTCILIHLPKSTYSRCFGQTMKHGGTEMRKKNKTKLTL